MALIVGALSAVPAEVDGTQRALRTVAIPPTPLGVYRASARTGNTATLAAGSEILSLRFGAAHLLQLRSLRIQAVVNTAFPTSQHIEAIVYLPTAYTVAATGGTAVTPTRLRSVHAASSVADLRTATTTALTVGTRTLGSIVARTGGITTTALSVPIDVTYTWLSAQSYGPILSGNEGLLIHNNILLGATGTIAWTFDLEWAELATTQLPG